MTRSRPFDDRRRAAGLVAGGLVFCYWLVVARPLFAVAMGSLVVAGERAQGPVGLDGRLPVRLVPAVVAVELGIVLRGALVGVPALGFVAGGLFLLAVWLNGPALGGWSGSVSGDPGGSPGSCGVENDPAD